MEKERIAITESQLPVSTKYTRLINTAIKSWTDNNNSGGLIPDRSDMWYDKAEKILQQYVKDGVTRIELDRGVGLYPTIEVWKNGEHQCLYSIDNFFKFLNGFWEA